MSTKYFCFYKRANPNPCFKNKIRLAALSLDQPSQKAITFPNDGLIIFYRSIAHGYNVPSPVCYTVLAL